MMDTTMNFQMNELILTDLFLLLKFQEVVKTNMSLTKTVDSLGLTEYCIHLLTTLQTMALFPALFQRMETHLTCLCYAKKNWSLFQ